MKIRTLSWLEAEQYMYAYLYSRRQPIYELAKRDMQQETGMAIEVLQVLLERLMGQGKIWYDENTAEVFLVERQPDPEQEEELLRVLQRVKSKLLVRTCLKRWQEQGLPLPKLYRHFGVSAFAHISGLLAAVWEDITYISMGE